MRMFGGKFKTDTGFTRWENGDTSTLIRDFEPDYQLVIVAYKDYRTQFVFWRGGNRLCDEGEPSYEVKCK